MITPWYLRVNLNKINERLSKVEKHSKEYDEIIKKYALAMSLQCKEGIGDVFPLEDFAEMVKDGSIIDYDGSGELIRILEEDFKYYLPKYEKDRLCGVKSVLTPKIKNKYQYVIWYNK